VQASDANVWLIRDGQRHAIVGDAELHVVCGDPARIIRVTDAALNSIPQGPNVGPLLPPDGTCVQASDPNVWVIQGGQRHAIVGDGELHALCGNPPAITHLSDADLSAIPQGPNVGPLLPPDGTCVQASDPNVWVIQGGQRHGIVGVAKLESLCGSPPQISRISDADLSAIPQGPNVGP
jgi:hypothetical protein